MQHDNSRRAVKEQDYLFWLSVKLQKLLLQKWFLCVFFLLPLILWTNPDTKYQRLFFKNLPKESNTEIISTKKYRIFRTCEMVIRNLNTWKMKDFFANFVWILKLLTWIFGYNFLLWNTGRFNWWCEKRSKIVEDLLELNC